MHWLKLGVFAGSLHDPYITLTNPYLGHGRRPKTGARILSEPENHLRTLTLTLRYPDKSSCENGFSAEECKGLDLRNHENKGLAEERARRDPYSS